MVSNESVRRGILKTCGEKLSSGEKPTKLYKCKRHWATALGHIMRGRLANTAIIQQQAVPASLNTIDWFPDVTLCARALWCSVMFVYLVYDVLTGSFKWRAHLEAWSHLRVRYCTSVVCCARLEIARTRTISICMTVLLCALRAR